VALVALIFLLPWFGAALIPYLRPLLGRHVGRLALVPSAASFLITLTFVSSTSHEQGGLYTLPWFPMLGLNFSLWVDGLSVFFALLIAGMGLLITALTRSQVVAWPESPCLDESGDAPGGTALYVVGGSALGLPLTKVRTFSFNAVYDRGMEALDDLGALFTKVFQSGYLKFSVMMTLELLVLSFTYPFIVKAGARWGALDLAPVEPYEAVLVALLMVGALAVTLATQPLSAVLTLGLVGLLVSFLFVVLRAPDLALTQLLIETASLILFLLVIQYLPPFTRDQLSWWVRGRDVAVSLMVGGLVVILLLIANRDTLYPSIASYFLEHSLRLGGGRNVVNVIVVDFRGYDTMGEITVLTIAAIDVYALIRLKQNPRQR
jgi:multisubunit Na+/H+ antiporter MnhB subunit